MRVIILRKIEAKSFIMTEQNVQGVPVVLTIKHIKDVVSYPIALLSESEINEFLLKMAEVKFYSKCFHSVKLNNEYHLGPQKNTRKLEITCFLDGKRSCVFGYEQEELCLDRIKSRKCSNQFVIEHIFPLFAKKVTQK